MKTSLSSPELRDYVCKQVDHLFPDGKSAFSGEMARALTEALERVEHCFRPSALPHYCADGQAIFNHLHSDQYAVFVWFLANSLWRAHGRIAVVDKLYYLNKALHGLDCMYDTALPDIFFFQHCVGTVLGKATYGDFFVASQGCTVGSHAGAYPVLGIGVALAAHSSVIGACTLGDRVSVGSNTAVFQTDVAADTVVYRAASGEIARRAANVPYAQRFFSVDLQRSVRKGSAEGGESGDLGR
jgi:serine O-acetyltransferase